VDRNREFTKVFTNDVLHSTVHKISGLVEQKKTNISFYESRFAQYLFQLGVRVQDIDLIDQAKALLPNLSVFDQIDVYSKISNYYLLNPFFHSQDSGEVYLKQALEVWRSSVTDRHQKKRLMSSYDYFNHDLRLLSTIIKYKDKHSLQEVKQGCLDFITTCPRNIQPLLLVSLAERLQEVEDKSQLLEYLALADTIVQDSSQTQAKVLEADLQKSLHTLLSPQASTTEGNTLFDLQLALALATNDLSIPKSLLTTLNNMETIHIPIFSSMPKLLIAKTFSKLGDRNSALSILHEVVEGLVDGDEEMKALLSQAEMFLPPIAVHFASICLELNEKDLARKVLPILTKPRQEKQFSFPIEQKLLLIDLGEYSSNNLREDIKQFERQLDSFQISPERPRAPPTPFSQMPPEVEIMLKLTELRACAEKLEESDLKELLSSLETSLLEKMSQSKGDPKSRTKDLDMNITPQSRVTPEMIIKAFKAGDLDQTNSLLEKFELLIHQQIETRQKCTKIPPPPPNLPPGASFGDPAIDRLLILSMLARVFIEVNQAEKASPIMKEIQTYLEVNEDKLDAVIKTAQPAFPILQLFRSYHKLKLKMGCSESEIDEIITNFQKFDPEGLIGFGVSLTTAGFVQHALTINKSKTGQSMKDGSWNQYYQMKSKFLKKLGEVDKTKEVLESTFDPFTSSRERWRFDASQLEQCLFLEDQVKIQEIIDLGMKNLFDPMQGMFSFTFVSPLISDHPPEGVKQEIWDFARNYLKEQFHQLLAKFEPGTQFVLRYTDFSDILLYMIKLDALPQVRITSLKILATLQNAIQTLAPEEIHKSIEFYSSPEEHWEFDDLLNLTLSRSNLHFVVTRDDYWTYYKGMGKSGSLTYDQFDQTYRKWISEQRSGKPTNMHLYLNIPFVYSSLIQIFDNLQEKELSDLCRKNTDILQEYRWKQVQETPSGGQVNSTGFTNLLTLVKLDLEASLKSHNYVEAYKILNLAFELLSHDAMHETGQSDGLSLDPKLLSVLDMFELLSKY
jgi:hypothetical protein